MATVRITKNRLSTEHKIELWHKKGEPYCSRCYEPVYGNVNPNAILTCGRCVQNKLRRHEKEQLKIVVPKPEKIKYGSQLKPIRKSLGINQQEMANGMNISISYYKKLERDKHLILKDLAKKAISFLSKKVNYE